MTFYFKPLIFYYREALNDWLTAKGRTPSKFRHLMCFHGDTDDAKSQDPRTKTSLSVRELNTQVHVKHCYFSHLFFICLHSITLKE